MAIESDKEQMTALQNAAAGPLLANEGTHTSTFATQPNMHS